jgi:Domain of unknown function (DUF1905)
MEYELQRFDWGMHFIVLHKKIVQQLTAGGNKRVLCRINDTINLHCAIMPGKEKGHYISIGRPVFNNINYELATSFEQIFNKTRML